ncbi:MAG: RDD family protein [Caldilineaceae bacterium]|nr:RDD family protein [Caldilineaceae bacterium]
MPQFAGILARFIALLIDNIMMWIIGVGLILLLGPFLGLAGNTDSAFLGLLAGTAMLVLLVIILALQFFYFGYMWSKSGQSIGMKMVGVRVVRRHDGGGLSFLRAGLRGTLGYYISGLLFSLGYIWAIFDPNKEAWHDKLFDTWVVNA